MVAFDLELIRLEGVRLAAAAHGRVVRLRQRLEPLPDVRW
jgi:hypothetical protein